MNERELTNFDLHLDSRGVMTAILNVPLHPRRLRMAPAAVGCKRLVRRNAETRSRVADRILCACASYPPDRSARLRTVKDVWKRSLGSVYFLICCNRAYSPPES